MTNGTIYVNGKKFGELRNAEIKMARDAERSVAHITIKRKRGKDHENITGDQRK